jgi:hypothetical protein
VRPVVVLVLHFLAVLVVVLLPRGMLTFAGAVLELPDKDLPVAMALTPVV